MSRLEEQSIEFRKREEARNIYNKNDEFGVSHPNALSDGDDKGKGENAGSIGSATDIKLRERAIAKNKYSSNNPYNDSNA